MAEPEGGHELQAMQQPPPSKDDLKERFKAVASDLVALVKKDEATFGTCDTTPEELTQMFEELLDSMSVADWLKSLSETPACRLLMAGTEEEVKVELPEPATGKALRKAAADVFRRPVTLYYGGKRLLDDDDLPPLVQSGEAVVHVVASAPPEDYFSFWKESKFTEVLATAFETMEPAQWEEGWQTSPAYHELVVKTYDQAVCRDLKRGGKEPSQADVADMAREMASLAEAIQDVSNEQTPEAGLQYMREEYPEEPEPMPVELWTGMGYTGQRSALGEGNFDTPAMGIPGNSLASIRVLAGHQAVLYSEPNFGGREQMVDKNEMDLGKLNFHNLTMSVKVQLAPRALHATGLEGQMVIVRQAVLEAYSDKWSKMAGERTLFEAAQLALIRYPVVGLEDLRELLRQEVDRFEQTESRPRRRHQRGT